MALHGAVPRRQLPIVAGLLAVISLVVLGAHEEPQFEFTPLDFPGALYTEASGINPEGDVVGLYFGGGAYHGFVLRDGQFASIDFPSAPDGPAVLRTQAGGINSAGDIVGAYRLAGQPGYVWHAFLLTRHGEYQNIDVPDWNGTLATGILPNGTIVGCVHKTNMTTTMHGFVRDPDGGVRVLDKPGTMLYGATPDLTLLVGRYIDTLTLPAQHFGLLVDADGEHYFRVPGSGFTQAWGVNPRGEVVGYYSMNATLSGFLKRGDELTTIAYPDAADSYVLGISADGDIVGGFSDAAGVGHAFVGRRVR